MSVHIVPGETDRSAEVTDLLARAEVVLGPEPDAGSRPGVRWVDPARLTVDQLTAELVTSAVAGREVVLLLGEDGGAAELAELTYRLDAAAVPWDLPPDCPS